MSEPIASFLGGTATPPVFTANLSPIESKLKGIKLNLTACLRFGYTSLRQSLGFTVPSYLPTHHQKMKI